MRGPYRAGLTSRLVVAVAAVIVACAPDAVPVPEVEGAAKSTALVRAGRRAYDGAPPTIPHDAFGMSCDACHDRDGTPVTGVGYAPASPHDGTPMAGATTRCRQCHVFAASDELFVESEFVGLPQDLRPGSRATPGAPPTIPHRTLMRENCLACHDGPGAREAIRTSHPERWRCRQCHVAVKDRESFVSAFGEGLSEPR